MALSTRCLQHGPRPRGRNGRRRERKQDKRDRHPTPTPAARNEAREQVEVREDDRVPSRPAVGEEQDHEHDRHDDERRESKGRPEAHHPSVRRRRRKRNDHWWAESGSRTISAAGRPCGPRAAGRREDPPARGTRGGLEAGGAVGVSVQHGDPFRPPPTTAARRARRGAPWPRRSPGSRARARTPAASAWAIDEVARTTSTTIADARGACLGRCESDVDGHPDTLVRMEAAAPRYCYRHPDRETGLSCSECGRPICYECMTPAPVGLRCPEHSGKPQGVRKVTRRRRARRRPASARARRTR